MTLKPSIAYVSQTLRNLPEAEYQVMKQKITTLLFNPQDTVEIRTIQSRSTPLTHATPNPFQAFQQPLIYQDYDFQDFSRDNQNFPVQAQIQRTSLLTQLQTRQPQHTHRNTYSIPEPMGNLSTVLGLTSQVLDEGSLCLMAQSKL